MPGFQTTSRSTTSLLLAMGGAAVAFFAVACGSDAGGEEGSGAGGGAELLRTRGSCSDPLDFDALSKERGDLPFVEGELSQGHELLQSGSCGGEGRELVYAWTPPRDGIVRLGRIDLTENLMIYARTSCMEPASELGCVRTEPIQVQVVGGETLYLVVDSQRDAPRYDLWLQFQPTDMKDGEPCGFSDDLGRCAPGLACVARQGRCAPNVPPVITDAKVHSFGDRFLARVWAQAQRENIVSMSYRFKDEAGDLTTDELVIDIKQYSYGKAEFEGGHIMALTAAAGAVSVEMRLGDDAGGSSNPIERRIEPAPLRGPGDECDPEFFLGACDEGLFCSTGSTPPHCEEALQEE